MKRLFNSFTEYRSTTGSVAEELIGGQSVPRQRASSHSIFVWSSGMFT